MNDLDELVRRTVATVTRITTVASRFAVRLFLLTTLVCVTGFVLGVAALDGGIQTVWIVLASVFGAIAVGGAFVALWRVLSVRRHADDLASEVRMIAERDGANSTVIDTFVVAVDENGEPIEGQGSAMVMSRQMGGFREVAGPELAQTPHLSAAVRAMTTLPLFAFMSIAISLVFGFMAAIFLIALAL